MSVVVVCVCRYQTGLVSPANFSISRASITVWYCGSASDFPSPVHYRRLGIEGQRPKTISLARFARSKNTSEFLSNSTKLLQNVHIAGKRSKDSCLSRAAKSLGFRRRSSWKIDVFGRKLQFQVDFLKVGSLMFGIECR